MAAVATPARRPAPLLALAAARHTQAHRGRPPAAALQRCRGFVGEGSRVAGEYHASDFEWEEVEEAGRAAVARQRRERAAHLAAPAAGGQLVGAPAGVPAAAGGSACEPSSADGSSGGEAERGGEADDSWERFHATHSQARFFKEKRYLMLEFPALGLQDPPQHIAEIGCGCGSALLPVLKANPSCRVTGCDISPTALQLLRRAAEQAGVEPGRIHTFVLNAGSSSGAGSSDSDSGGASPLAGLAADSCLLVFTLSALAPEDQPAVLAHAFAALRPGGLLLFRDYGLYDMAQLRFPGAQMLGDNLYRRNEGTLAYFFSTQRLRSLAAAAGFQKVECEYARVENRNRKSGAAMRRVFLHGVFRKPASAAA